MRRLALRLLVSLVPLLLAPSLLHAQQKEILPGHFVIFVAPDYPTTASTRGETAVIDVKGQVQPDGSFVIDSIQAVDMVLANLDFEREIREAAKLWWMSPGYGTRCEPAVEPVFVRIWFEMKEGKPTVFFSQQADSQQPAQPKPRVREDMRYPRKPLHEGVYHAYVMAQVRIGKDGAPEEVFFVGPDTKYQRYFHDEVGRALRQYRWESHNKPEAQCYGTTVEFVAR